MLSQISKALSNGFTSEQVLNFILKKFPKYSEKIQKALASGFTVDQVLQFLSHKSSKNSSMDESLSPVSTEFEQTRSQDIKKQTERNQSALKLGSLAATSLATPMLSSALQRALPNSLQGLIPALTAQSQQQTQLSPQQPPSVSPTTISETLPKVQPEQKTINISDLLSKSGLKNHIDELSKTRKDPKEIAAILYNQFPKEMKEFQQQAGKNMEDAIGDYLAESKLSPTEELTKKTQVESQNQPEKIIDLKGMGKGITDNLYEGIYRSLQEGKDTFGGIKDPLLQAAKPAYDAGQIQSPEDLKKFADFWNQEKQKINKGSIAGTPQGIGEVKEIRNGKALIDIDGKKHVVDEDELIQSPIDEKDLADLYDDLIQGIEKHTGKQVSRNVEWAGYDPNTNELAYRPHGSKLWVYGDISEEDKNILTGLLTQRKSTGSNFIGAWEKNTESPIGAAMYQLIQKLQKERGGKGNEYKNRYETIYDAIEPARTASKERYVQRKKKTKKPRND